MPALKLYVSTFTKFTAMSVDGRMRYQDLGISQRSNTSKLGSRQVCRCVVERSERLKRRGQKDEVKGKKKRKEKSWKVK
jgi:hypothetical protein